MSTRRRWQALSTRRRWQALSTRRGVVGAAVAVALLVAAFAACDRGDAARGGTPGEPSRGVVAPREALPVRGVAAEADSVHAAEGGGVADASVAAASVAARAGSPARFVSLDVDDDEWIARMRVAQPVRFKPVGTSSLVFKTSFVGGLEAAFRPRTRTQPRGWTNEVAAYRIARALDMDQVPPAVSRAFSRVEIEGHLHADFAEDWPDIDDKMMGRGEIVWGALVFWVPGLRDLELDTPRGMAAWSRWLAHDAGVVSADEASLAGDLSTMLCFDYLVGNVDRWSGGNVRADRSGRRVAIRDHNLAFLSPLPRAQHERVLGHVRRAQRFSRRFVVALRALDEPRLRAALGDDPAQLSLGHDPAQLSLGHDDAQLSLGRDPAVAAGTSLLDDAQIRAVLDRRAALLSRVAALMDAYGESDVLAFP